MSAIGPSLIHDVTAGGALRAKGNLAAGSVLVQGNTYRERFRAAANLVAFEVRAKMAVSGGTPTVQAVAEQASIQGNDLTVADATSGLTAATSLVNNTEANHAYTPPKGETFIDVVIDVTGGSAAGTITYVDVLTRIQ
jgi:hypothetical protein